MRRDSSCLGIRLESVAAHSTPPVSCRGWLSELHDQEIFMCTRDSATAMRK